MGDPRITVRLTLAPWARLYLLLMARMLGGAKAGYAVTKFILDHGLVRDRG